MLLITNLNIFINMSVCSRNITINFYIGVSHSLQKFPKIIVYTIIQMADNIKNISLYERII